MTTEPREGSDGEARPAPPADPEQLRQDIERTREELGETVEALIAKADVKARARERVGEISERLRGATSQAREQATARVGQAKTQIAGRSADAKHAAAGRAVPTDQLQARAAAVGRTVRDLTPGPVQKAAQRAVATASQRRMAVVAAAVGVAVVGFVLVRRWRR
jgi:hypothetical protein